MKQKIFNIISVASVLLTLTFISSCEEQVIQPEACVTISKLIVQVNEEVLFENCGVGDLLTIWTGDQGHNIDSAFISGADKYVERDKGEVVSDGVFSYSYPEPGTYKIVWIATNVGNDGKEFLKDQTEFAITVQP